MWARWGSSVSRSGPNLSSNVHELASHEPEGVCRAPTTPPASPSAPSGGDSWATTTTPFLPVDHPASGIQLHKFRATGEVSWECMADCVSSQGLTGNGLVAAEGIAKAVGSNVAKIAAPFTAAIVTPLACYVACSDLEGLPPKTQPEPVEVPDASIYSVAIP